MKKKIFTVVLLAAFAFQPSGRTQPNSDASAPAPDQASAMNALIHKMNELDAQSNNPAPQASTAGTPASAAPVTAATTPSAPEPVASAPGTATTPVLTTPTPGSATPVSSVPTETKTELVAQNETVPVTNDTSTAGASGVSATNEASAVATEVNTLSNAAAAIGSQAAAVSNEAVAVASQAAAPVGSPMPPAAPQSIPLIQFQDVPITVAIENLARQAGINYLLDPKIVYGQPDQTGQIRAEPTLSIRWENVTAEQALLALLDNYDMQLLRDPRTKIARITTKDPTAPPALMTRVVQLKFASTSNMVQSVQAALTDRRSHVIPDTRTSQIVVVATQPEQDSIDMLVNQLDKPTRQVLIETKLVEVNSSPQTAKGINWSGTLAAQNFSFGNGAATIPPSPSSGSTTTFPGTPVTSTTTYPSGATTSSTTTPSHSTATTFLNEISPSILPGGLSFNTLSGFAPSIGFLNADGVQGVLSFLNSEYSAQVLSTPSVVTLDNQPAVIEVTTEYPVINVTASTAGVSSGSSQISYSNIGTILQVTPRITANDYVWLKVIPEVSSFFDTESKVIAGQTYQADVFDFRHIESQVMIPNANTLVMGGLVQDNPSSTWTKVPLLGDIPGLGWAFKSESSQMVKDNLIIFITPTIVKDTDYQPTTSHFLASQPTAMKEPMNPNSVWDSSRPDWSNPAPEPGEFDKSPQVQ